MPTPHIPAQIEATLRPLADAQQAEPMLDQFAFLGTRATPRRQALRGLPKLSYWTAPELLVLAERVWDQPEREFQYAAVDLPVKHHRQLGPDNVAHLLQLVQRKPWWDTVDGLAGVAGDVLLRAPQHSRVFRGPWMRACSTQALGAPRGHAAPMKPW